MGTAEVNCPACEGKGEWHATDGSVCMIELVIDVISGRHSGSDGKKFVCARRHTSCPLCRGYGKVRAE